MLKPGEKEKWTLKVLNMQGKPENVELGIFITDASRNPFFKKEWNLSEYDCTFNKPEFGIYNNTPNTFNSLMDKWYYRNTNYINIDCSMPYLQFDFSPYLFQIRHVYGSVKLFESSTPGGFIIEVSEKRPVELSHGRPVISSNGPEPETTLEVKESENIFSHRQLQTNKKGVVKVKFSMHKIVGEWDVLIFAHTKDGSYLLDKRRLVTEN